MGLLDRSNKENSNSVMEGVALKCAPGFCSLYNVAELSYEDDEFKLSGRSCDKRFNFHAFHNIYNIIQRKFTLSTDLDLYIEACDSLLNDRIKIKTSKDISIYSSKMDKHHGHMITIQNIDVNARAFCATCTYIKLVNINIKAKTITLFDLTYDEVYTRISGHIESGKIVMHMYDRWDFMQILENVIGVNATSGILYGKSLDDNQINELQNINPITDSKINIFNTDIYCITYLRKYVIITRNSAVIDGFKESSYKMADGWYLIYTGEPIDLYEFVV
jgi:hypothetical protein